MRVGIDKNSGAVLTGWDHVAQSIHDIITTPSNSRMFRRAYGGDVDALIDAPMNDSTLMTFFVSVAMALEGYVEDGLGELQHIPSYGEPGFQLRRVYVESAGPDGVIELVLSGDHYPDGHAGNFDTVVPVEGLRVIL